MDIKTVGAIIRVEAVIKTAEAIIEVEAITNTAKPWRRKREVVLIIRPRVIMAPKPKPAVADNTPPGEMAARKPVSIDRANGT
jgi:hypothetical protein